jgi:hypothetical protein
MFLMVIVSNGDNLAERFNDLIKFKYKVFSDLETFEFSCSRIYNGAYSKKEIGSQLAHLEIQSRIHPNLHLENVTDFCFFGYSGYRATQGNALIHKRLPAKVFYG